MWLYVAYTADKPKILGDDEITDGETLKVLCLVPVNYLGGDCRLYREGSYWPFKLVTATSYTWEFHLTSKELLGNNPVTSTVRLRCDYKIQEYSSASSDTKLFTVSGESSFSPKDFCKMSSDFPYFSDLILTLSTLQVPDPVPVSPSAATLSHLTTPSRSPVLLRCPTFSPAFSTETSFIYRKVPAAWT